MSPPHDGEARRTVLIVGYGHFGRALATLLAEAGDDVRALDPYVEVPRSLRPADDDPFASARFVFVCVPVWAFDVALGELRPRLRPGNIVVDVSSVRSGPDRSMRALLGRPVMAFLRLKSSAAAWRSSVVFSFSRAET
jgi:prephenate dehydrogenase